MFAENNKSLIILLLLLAVVLLLLRRTGQKRGKESRAAHLMKQYEHMTREKLLAVPEGELVEAVVCRVLAKADASRRPDPLRTLAELAHGSTVVYTVWAVCREMAAGDFAALRRTATWKLADRATEAFRAVGAAATAETWQRLLAAGEDVAEAEAAFHQAVEQEQPLGLCEQYILDHVDEFLDESPAIASAEAGEEAQ